MNDASSTVNPDDLLFAEFLLDFEQRGQAAVADCGKRLPHLVPRIQEWLGLQNAIEESRPPEAEQLPAELGNYRILRRLHGGGMKQGTVRVCDTKSSLLLCRVAEPRRHLPFCRQYPSGTGVTDEV